ncbi:MAG: biotin--[acetyl-CoA-carboxylase] ligase [Firmicutes bacterium]|nr:biotin--[acetyl-CoA-carboxylase] ligase [Bacillota bacterium]
MNSNTLERLSDTQVIGRRFQCLDTIDSTNTECKRRALAGEPEGLVITAEEQTAGRGRYGRSFHSPKGKGLYYSCLLRPQLRPEEAVNLTAWIAAAVCDAIEETCGVSTQIKWTNDIILDGKKLCGILTEMEVDAETGTVRYIVPGIGINVNHREEDLEPSIRPIATSLAMHLGHEVDRTALAAALTRHLDRLYSVFPAQKEEYLQKYRQRCCTVGIPLMLHYAGGTCEEAYGLAIDDDFRLVVRMADGQVQHVSTGEVSVRGLCGYV